MPNNLFALVGSSGSADVRRVQVTADVQNQLAGLFTAYEASFLDGIDEEIAFSRDWKADEDELLTLPVSPQITEIVAKIQGGPLALEVISPQGFASQNVRALIFSASDMASPLYVQYFSAAQHLSRGFTLFADGGTFTKLNGPAFIIGSKIDALVEGDLVKFKNFGIVKRFFNLMDNYVEASDEQIEQFSEHLSVHIEDLEQFKAATNQTTRKLISSVVSSGILDELGVDVITESAANVGVNVAVANGKLVFPTDKSELKMLLRFLDHGVYQSPLAQRRFIANSKRPL